MRVYTLGDDSVSPFRLNPFEFELSDLPSSGAVLSHIDFLKAVFNAAFILYAPMPYVLDMALHEIYLDKGWDLATGINSRLQSENWNDKDKYPIFPTLSDLYNKIEVITQGLGYESRIEQDVIAGLKARIGSLRLGSKGLMLDTPRGLPISKLLSHPTVLELDKIGNDDEKTFLMGLLLTKIVAFHRNEIRKGNSTNQLKNVLVIEEAHRLLKNVSTIVDVESSNLRAQAIETFTNLLSEIRYYGQAVIIAEQIPSKLTPDVIKNTNLKLVHRLVAKDDRELVGSAMNLSDDETRFFSLLSRGKALVFSEGDDRPYYVSIPNVRERNNPFISDEDLIKITRDRLSLRPYLPVLDFSEYGIKSSYFSVPDQGLYQSALRIIDGNKFRRSIKKLILRILFCPETANDIVLQLIQVVSSSKFGLSSSQFDQIIKLAIVLGINQEVQNRGNVLGWDYESLDRLRFLFSNISINLLSQSASDIDNKLIDEVVKLYKANSRIDFGPFPGCEHCSTRCLFLLDVKGLLLGMDLDNIVLTFRNRELNLEQKYDQIVSIGNQLIYNWLGGKSALSPKIAYCAMLESSYRMGLDEFMQKEFASQVHSLQNSTCSFR